MEVRWSPSALRDVDLIHDFIAQDSDKYARKTIDKFFNRVLALQTNPMLGRMVPEYNDPNIRELLEGNYRIVYRLFNDAINIARVHHSAQDITKQEL